MESLPEGLPASAANAPSGGLFPFCEDGKWGYINAEGTVVIARQFEFAGTFSEGCALVVGSSGAEYIDARGRRVFAVADAVEDPQPFSEGLAVVAIQEKYGYMDKTGKIVIQPRFDEARAFSEGLAAVNVGARTRIPPGGRFGGKWGFIDRSGRMAIPARFGSVWDFREGVAMVSKPPLMNWDFGRFAYVDRTGKTVLDPEDIERASGFTVVQGSSFSEALARIEVLPSDRRKEARGGTTFKAGFVDKTGKFVVLPKYDGAGDFSEGLAPVSLDGRWGYINRLGRMIVQPEFDQALGFCEGLAPVRVGQHWGYIDKQGQLVVDPRDAQGRPGPINEASCFFGGLAYVHIGGKSSVVHDAPGRYWFGGAWYYMDPTGNVVRLYRNDDDPLQQRAYFHPRQ